MNGRATESWDLVVVGAGPAGATAALAALNAEPSLKVLLLDRSDFPRDKSCGDGIAPHCFEKLASIGVTGVEAGWTPLTRLELARGDQSVAGTMARPVYVIPREVFDARLVERAVDRGATFRRERVASVDALPPARVVVGADGAHSVVRAHLGLPYGRRALAIRGYAPTPPDRRGTQVIRYGDRRQPAYAWAFDRGDGLSNVGYGELLPADGEGDPPSRALLLDQLELLLPGSVDAGGQWKGHHLPLSGWRWEQPDGRLLLAGDAAGLINPMTGEGIYYAIATGIAAGRSAVRGPARGRGPGGAAPAGGPRPARPAPQAHLRRLQARGAPDDRRRRHPGGPPRRAGLRRAGRARARRRPDLRAAGPRAGGRPGPQGSLATEEELS